MTERKEILFEGFTSSEILEAAKSEEFRDLVFSNEPISFKVGSSEVLGQFKTNHKELEITFSHIIGGGEGVLLKIMNLFRRFARESDFEIITWTLYAVDCHNPNPKLPRVLKLKGFTIVDDPVDGQVYRKREMIK